MKSYSDLYGLGNIRETNRELKGIVGAPEILQANFDDSLTQLGAGKKNPWSDNPYSRVYIDEMVASDRVVPKIGVGVRKPNNFSVPGLGTSGVMRKTPPPGRPDPRKNKRPLEK